MSPLIAVTQLIAFRRGMVGMTQGAFDEAFDAITGFLEQCNNETYRLIPSYEAEEDIGADNK